MATTRKNAENETNESEALAVVVDTPVKSIPARSGSATKIPSKSGRKSNEYAEWADEIAELRANLGTAFSYENTANVNTVVQGVRRIYGVLAATRDYDKENKTGTLWLEYPSKKLDDGTLVEDTDKVAEILAKYSKSA
jgi:hypothetical protein